MQFNDWNNIASTEIHGLKKKGTKKIVLINVFKRSQT